MGRENVFTARTVKTSLYPYLHDGSHLTVPQTRLKFSPWMPAPICVTDFWQGLALQPGFRPTAGLCVGLLSARTWCEPTGTPEGTLVFDSFLKVSDQLAQRKAC